MFNLSDREGNLILRRNGTPFEYSTREFATIGARVLGKELDTPLRVVGN
ncbi:hypothetical protein GCM10022287_22560 [Gryllotalpicola koreensis]|uniref:Uncharacterized protein n=1 Tax=Gryllotalpicola koreensis TaxID=993086 RepID=A0ABP8A268_9MICO